MRNFFLFLILFSILFIGCASGNPDTLKIAVITDIHFLSYELVSEGKALTSYENSTGRNVKELHEVLDKVLDDLHSEKIDILLVAGDMSNHGELQSHKDFINKLQPLVSSGTRIFVIPGNNDVSVPDAKAYIGDKFSPAETISKEEFAKLYGPYGYDNSLERDESSLSYLAEINENTRLLAFDSNRYDENTATSISSGRIRDETMAWAINILEEAKEQDIRIIGMMHHGLVEHMPYQSVFFSDYLIDDWQNKADMLADAGLEVIFTGHFHSNDVTLRNSPAGNVIYDVETASLAQYPFAYRIMNLSNSELSIDTRFITSVPSNINLERDYKEKLETITRRVAQGKLGSLGLPIPEDFKNVLADLMVKLNIAHVKGDEKPDPEMMMTIRAFASLLENEVNIADYSFDFPPEDNKLLIEFTTLENKTTDNNISESEVGEGNVQGNKVSAE